MRDVYMVANVEKGSTCFFRATGKVELWDATDGSVKELPVIRQTSEGTWIRMDKEFTNSYLIVFSPGEPKLLEEIDLQIPQPKQIIPVEGEWTIQVQPTLDNQWGDFRLPASNEMIGVEARVFDFKAREWSEWHKEGIYGYGPQMVLRHNDSEEEYAFSWEYGVWDNPGSQGWHGLKGKVSDGFLILDKGSKQVFSTHVYATRTNVYRIEQSHESADRICVDGKEISGEVRLKKGWHSLEVEYGKKKVGELQWRYGEMRDFRLRGAVVLFPKDAPVPTKPSIYGDRVCMLWTSSDHLMYDPYKGAHPVWDYRFTSAPGMKRMEFAVYGKLKEVSVAGQAYPIETIGGSQGTDVNRYAVTLPKPLPHIEEVAFSIEVQKGRQGTGAIAEPIKITTEEGRLEAGDWSKAGALRFYSGGMVYKKEITLDELHSQRVMLDLGSVVATCEIKVNGKALGVRMSPPYSVDITKQIRPGKNEIEVLVYSTLANHYQTQPTPYRGEPVAGILGPVEIEIY